jgi:ATP synthase protein I
MADDTRGTGDHSEPPDDEAALSARLQSLGKRLAQKRASHEAETDAPPSSNTAGIALGLRLSTELIAGVVVGAAIGWLLDRWLGISPWGFIVFLLLGFVAGLLNMLRSAGIVAERGRGERR